LENAEAKLRFLPSARLETATGDGSPTEVDVFFREIWLGLYEHVKDSLECVQGVQGNFRSQRNFRRRHCSHASGGRLRFLGVVSTGAEDDISLMTVL
jgi:hypothetical protein